MPYEEDKLQGIKVELKQKRNSKKTNFSDTKIHS